MEADRNPFDLYEEAADHVREFGPFLKTSDGKKSYKNPFLTIMRATLKIILQISDQFGFTPLSQSRIKGISREPEDIFDDGFSI